MKGTRPRLVAYSRHRGLQKSFVSAKYSYLDQRITQNIYSQDKYGAVGESWVPSVSVNSILVDDLVTRAPHLRPFMPKSLSGRTESRSEGKIEADADAETNEEEKRAERRAGVGRATQGLEARPLEARVFEAVFLEGLMPLFVTRLRPPAAPPTPPPPPRFAPGTLRTLQAIASPSFSFFCSSVLLTMTSVRTNSSSSSSRVSVYTSQSDGAGSGEARGVGSSTAPRPAAIIKYFDDLSDNREILGWFWSALTVSPNFLATLSRNGILNLGLAVGRDRSAGRRGVGGVDGGEDGFVEDLVAEDDFLELDTGENGSTGCSS